MRILYLIQTFSDREQIARLVRAIRASDPYGVVVITHNSSAFVLDAECFGASRSVHVINYAGGSRIDFSLPAAYLEAIEFARARGIDYDWVVNLTGQCYPVRPLTDFARHLDGATVDGFIDLHPVFEDPDTELCGIWPRVEAHGRYRYQYRWRLTTQEPPVLLRKLLGAVRLAVNGVQPWIWLDTSYGLQLGVRDTSGTFGPDFPLYGGSYYMTLSRRAAEYLCEFARSHPQTVAHFSRMNIPSEVFPHTVLASNPALRLSLLNHHFYDVSTGKRGRPAILTLQDRERIVESGKFFARKFDVTLSAGLLDMLDQRLAGGRHRIAPASSLRPAVARSATT